MSSSHPDKRDAEREPLIYAPVSRWSSEVTTYQRPAPAVEQFSYKGAQPQTRFRDFGTPPNPMATEEQVLSAAGRRVLLGRLYDLGRNNEFVAGIVEALVTSVGVASLRSVSTASGDTGKAAAINRRREEFYFQYFENVETSGEAIDGVIRMVLEQLLTAGEAFVSFTQAGRVQLIESSYIGSPADKLNPDGSSEIQGVLRNAFGTITGYRMARRLPNGSFTFEGGEILPAETTAHVFRKDRPNQVRGIPWLAAAIVPLQDLGELMSARVTQAKNAAMLSAVVKKHEAEPIAGDVNDARSNYKEWKTGAIYYLETGESIDLIESKTNAGDFSVFERRRLESILSTVGMPLEVLYGYRESSYASSKHTALVWRRRVLEFRRLIESKLLTPLYRWRSRKAVDEGDLDTTDNLINWTWTAFSTLDPQRDATVNALNLANNITTLQEIYAERGQYWEEPLEQRARELAKAQELGVKYKINPQLLMDTARVDVVINQPAAGEEPTDLPPALPAAA